MYTINIKRGIIVYFIMIFCFYWAAENVLAQTGGPETLTVNPDETKQTVVGFGAALGFYENWLTAHPRKAEIYEAIFGELSLDILRVRNAYGYDAGMVDRVQQFTQAAELSLGKPIKILSTSWGPPAALKSNNDRKNGGSLNYSIVDNKVSFDYTGFANWWGESLDDYNAHGVFPEFISIQNEPDFSASWESCLFQPSEKINSSDTIAGYNKALDAVYDLISLRDKRPKILGPETVGIGYNSVENYVNALDRSKLFGIAHHLYHGVDENNPYTTTDMTKVGNFHPETPHFQTEYSRGDWLSLGGLIYKSFHDENVVAYLYWDLIWNVGGLVSLDNPWNQASWQDPLKGYTLNKTYFAFKQFSKFIHPGWQRTTASISDNTLKTISFINPGKDSATIVIVNPSLSEELEVEINIPGRKITSSGIYVTSESENCQYNGELSESRVIIGPASIVTVEMGLGFNTGQSVYATNDKFSCKSIFPNPTTEYGCLNITLFENQTLVMSIFDIRGKELRKETQGEFGPGNYNLIIQRNSLKSGLYFYKLENLKGEASIGRFVIRD